MNKGRAASDTDVNRVSVRRPDPRVWRQALQLAGGDHRRLDVQQDGTVVVRNQKSG